MHYLISGKLVRRHEVLGMAHAEFTELIQSKVLPTLQVLSGKNPHGTVLAGGIPAGGRDFVMIVDLAAGESHRCVRQFLSSLPIFEYYEWETVPLESFHELALAFGA